ncbi:autotransporter outer membrane beta-barrel domain-containing protein [Mucilaginibacter limnophilus]|uniref:Autotransporter outer membrane beta-barrel domain-containing protein n=1 Tax=Mucilaginibacter limnophilus TaxID=1932778 RepID=A0A3S2V9J4_9SPHI|nr:DUF6850 family outer membrane beta-barrel protein [Mucilaginibacter limnophilus]RVU02026.1 autotransporter outer membrane beta-barrel domain-containing protein [Mucilaginibacter limnophilus]
MTKFFVVMLLCGIAVQASYAQTEKGQQHLGLSFGASTTNGERTDFDFQNNVTVEAKTKSNQYNIAASYSYFIADKLDLGLSAGYGYGNNEVTNTPNGYNLKSDSYFSNIFLRKYFLFNDKIGVRTGPSLAYSKSKNKYVNYPEQTQNIKEISGGIRLDFVYFPVKNLGLASGIGNVSYSHQKTTGYQPASSNTFGISFINSLNLSIYYIL